MAVSDRNQPENVDLDIIAWIATAVLIVIGGPVAVIVLGTGLAEALLRLNGVK